ncbi:hypothetical protein HK097_007913 [Rhizophlyctis rosea]|uniref:F-box domain-containing protein n=1 Tax=Rhizophlyctis rosea TaxID=64517 RepID=A0AAD5X499_9FUNG|nr:hypothetical protein HK097_007913 [Rhizophlyctis rosea]
MVDSLTCLPSVVLQTVFTNCDLQTLTTFQSLSQSARKSVEDLSIFTLTVKLRRILKDVVPLPSCPAERSGENLTPEELKYQDILQSVIFGLVDLRTRWEWEGVDVSDFSFPLTSIHLHFHRTHETPRNSSTFHHNGSIQHQASAISLSAPNLPSLTLILDETSSYSDRYQNWELSSHFSYIDPTSGHPQTLLYSSLTEFEDEYEPDRLEFEVGKAGSWRSAKTLLGIPQSHLNIDHFTKILQKLFPWSWVVKEHLPTSVEAIAAPESTHLPTSVEAIAAPESTLGISNEWRKGYHLDVQPQFTDLLEAVLKRASGPFILVTTDRMVQELRKQQARVGWRRVGPVISMAAALDDEDNRWLGMEYDANWVDHNLPGWKDWVDHHASIVDAWCLDMSPIQEYAGGQEMKVVFNLKPSSPSSPSIRITYRQCLGLLYDGRDEYLCSLRADTASDSLVIIDKRPSAEEWPPLDNPIKKGRLKKKPTSPPKPPLVLAPDDVLETLATRLGVPWEPRRLLYMLLGLVFAAPVDLAHGTRVHDIMGETGKRSVSVLFRALHRASLDW